MNFDIMTWAWLAAGVVLLSIEFAFPQLFTCFFGVGALVVALLNALGIISDPILLVVVWVFVSLVLVAALRQYARKYFRSETSYQSTDEDIEAIGQIVDVVTAVSDQNDQGRVRFQGTTWPAVSTRGTIAAGQKARLLYRDNLLWKVEQYSPEDENMSGAARVRDTAETESN